MKLKLSLSKEEGTALLTAVPGCNRFYHWASGIYISRMPDNTVYKIILHTHDGQSVKRYTLTPESMMRGANLAIQPESKLEPELKEAIRSGKFTPDIVLDTVIQIALFGEVVHP